MSVRSKAAWAVASGVKGAAVAAPAARVAGRIVREPEVRTAARDVGRGWRRHGAPGLAIQIAEDPDVRRALLGTALALRGAVARAARPPRRRRWAVLAGSGLVAAGMLAVLLAVRATRRREPTAEGESRSPSLARPGAPR